MTRLTSPNFTAHPPATVELARQAQECAIITRARQLADWVGPAGRPVTAGGVLRRADTSAAGDAIAVVVPAALRSAADVEALHRPWTVAQAAGWLKVGDGRAAAVAPPGEQTADDVLRRWSTALDATLLTESNDRLRRGGAAACWAVLTALVSVDAGGGTTFEDLEQAVVVVFESSALDVAGFDFGDVGAAYQSFRRGSSIVEAAVLLLAEFGAVTAPADGAMIRLTPLGRWAEELSRARAAAADPSGLTASALLARLAEVPDPEGWTGDGEGWALAERWLGDRDASEAATEVLAAAAVAAPVERVLGVKLALAMGDPALPAWQAALDVPRLAVYARAALTADDDASDDGSESDETESDETDTRWFAVEQTLVTLDRDGAEDADYAVRQFGGWDALRGSGHPDEQVLADAVAGVASSRRPARVFELRIALSMYRPSVWRTVRMEASATLADLHDVIRVVMGWDDDHLHMFFTGGRYPDKVRYSDPDFGLDECADEYEFRLARVLPEVGAVVNYIYDLGDEWHHTITLKRVLEADPTHTYPFCVTGRGDAPVEDWQPPDPDYPDDEPTPESVPFDLAEINRLLAGLAGPVEFTLR